MPKRLIKSIYFSLAAIFLALLVGAFFISRPSEIHVSAYTKPYSINSMLNVKDSVDIIILIDEAESFYSDKTQILSAYVKGDEGELKLNIKEIMIENDSVLVNDEKFYVFHYYFDIDFKALDHFELFIKDAYLEIEFLNDVKSKIHIGSFSYFKYSKSSNDIMFSLLKVINTYDDETNLFGFQIGIRNLSNTKITIKSINLLDVNAKLGSPLKLDNAMESKKVRDYFDNYNDLDNVLEFDLSIDSLENVIYAFPLVNMNDYNLMYPLERLGFNITYILNNMEYNYVFENFLFYSSSEIDFSKHIFDVYTYDNN